MPPKVKPKNAIPPVDESGDDSAPDEDALNATIRTGQGEPSSSGTPSATIDVRLSEMMQQIQNLRAEVEKSNLIAQASTASNSINSENNDPLAAALSELSRTLSISRPEYTKKLYDLPVFDGTPEVWPMFKESFTMTTSEYNYDERQNMLRLQKALKGKAYEAVDCLLIHSRNVPQIMKSLEEKFGRADQLVLSQIAKVRNVAPISESAIEQIIPFATKVQNLASFLEAAGGKQHLANPSLMNELLRKLPAQRQIEWVRYSKTLNDDPTVKHFSEWLQELSNVVNTICINFSEEETRRSDNRGGGRARFFYADVVEPDVHRQLCLICTGEHEIDQCKRFITMNLKQRWQLVRRKRLCFNCLNEKHISSSCDKKHRCDTTNCTKKLHGLLHYGATYTEPDGRQSTLQPQRHVFTNSANHPESKNLLFKVIPVKLFANGKEVNCYALFDEGSAISLINKSLVDQLGLKGKREDLKLQWFGDKTVTEQSSKVDMVISGVHQNSRKFSLKGIRTVKDLRLPTQSMNVNELEIKYRNMKKINALSYNDATPELLIGLDNAHLGVAKRTAADGLKGPAVILTKLGWVVYGSGKDCSTDNRNHIFLARATNKDNDELEQLVQNYIADENLGVCIVEKKIESHDLTRAKNLLELTTIGTPEK